MIDVIEKRLLPLYSNSPTSIYINVWLEATTSYVILFWALSRVTQANPWLFTSSLSIPLSEISFSLDQLSQTPHHQLALMLDQCSFRLIRIQAIRSLIRSQSRFLSRHGNAFIEREIARWWTLLVLTRCGHKTSCFVLCSTCHLFTCFLSWERRNYCFLFSISLKGQFYSASHIVVAVMERKLNSRPTITLSLLCYFLHLSYKLKPVFVIATKIVSKLLSILISCLLWTLYLPSLTTKARTLEWATPKAQ